MKSLQENTSVKKCQVSSDNILSVDLKKLESFSSNDNNNCSEALNEINKIFKLLQYKINSYGYHLEIEKKNLENKCVSLETKIQELQKPCSQCVKYCYELDNLVEQNYSKFQPFHRQSNNHTEETTVKHAIHLQELDNLTEINDADKNQGIFRDNGTSDARVSSKDIPVESDLSQFIKTLTPKKLPEENTCRRSLTTTPTDEKSTRETSPVVQKQLRSGKRKMLRLSSQKKCRLNNDDTKLSPTQFPGIPDLPFDEPLINIEQESRNDSKNELSEIESASYINTPSSEVFSDDSLVAPSPVPVSKNQGRVNSIFGGKKVSNLDFLNKTALNTLSANLPENSRLLSSLLDKSTDPCDNLNKPKTKWDLKTNRSIDSSNKKFKQTTLSTSVVKKKVDVSSLNHFQGGAISDNITLRNSPEDMELTNISLGRINTSSEKENKPISMNEANEILQETTLFVDKTKTKSLILNEPKAAVKEIFFPIIKLNEKNKAMTEYDLGEETTFLEDEPKEVPFLLPKPNLDLEETFFQDDKTNKDGLTLQETCFNPMITSTATILETEKKSPLKTIQPPKTVQPPKNYKNSFDFVPSPESPKYKYRRDALRKKADRQKLPGQECVDCLKFYLEGREEFGETQLHMIRKCSRHRDKYPLHANTPPGLWNPKFDDTDVETG